MTKRLEELAASGETNILKTDIELSTLVKRLDNIKKYKSFQKWKSKFLDRLDQYLYAAGKDPAEKCSNKFDQSLKKFVKSTAKVQGFIEKGELGDDKKTVKASLALNEMCNQLTDLNGEIEVIIPFKRAEEKKRGFTKFHLGAVLIQQGFTQYASMEVIRDALTEIGAKLENVADRQQHELFEAYKKQVIRFCDIMADLGLYEIMKKCMEFANAPDYDESSSEDEPLTINVKIECYDGKTINLELDPSETIGNVQAAIAPGARIPVDEQVLQFEGNYLDDPDQTLNRAGVQDGATLWLQPRNVTVNVNMPDGTTHPLKLALTDTKRDIQKKIEVQLGMPVDQQVVTHNGQDIPGDGKSVKFMKIQEGDNLDVGVLEVPITVNTMDGKQIQVMVDPKKPVSEIKKKLQAESGLKPSNQNLFMNGNELDDDDKPAEEYGVKAGSVLDLEPKKIKVQVEMPDGSKQTVELAPSDTPKDIKAKIAEQTGMDAPKQVVKFKGKEIPSDDSNKTVKDMGIREGSDLKVEVKKVPITVTTMDGKKIKAMIDPTEPLGEIKKQIAEESGVPADNQRLFMNGEELANDKKPAEAYGIKEGSELDMEPKVIKVNVEMPDGTKHEVGIAPSDTSDDIKDKIAKQTGMKAPRQVIKVKGKELPEGKSVKDMGIREGDDLDVEVKKVPITVNTMDGRQIKAMIDPSEKLGDIKKQIEHDVGVPADNQRLFMGGKELADDEKPAEDYGIKSGSELDMEPKSMKVTVDTPDGKTHEVDIAPSDTLDDVKKKIAAKTGIIEPRQVIRFNGNELPNDGSTVKDMGINDGDNLKVEIKKVPITVNTMDGKKIKVKIDPTEPLSAIKNLVAKESGVPADNQKLFMNGTELDDDDKAAQDYGIQAGSELDMEPKTMKVDVEMPDGSLKHVNISPDDTADDIKAKIAKETGMAVPRQVVKFNGKELPKDGTARDMGIGDGDRLKVEVYKVPVTVNTMDGKQIKLMVDPTDKIGNIKKQLEEESGLPADNQNLFKQGNLLGDDKKSAKDYGIKEGTELDLEPKKMTVSVTMPDGKKHKIEISPSDNADNIKAKIEAESGMAVPRQVLKFNGNQFPKGKNAREMGVKDGDNLDVEIFKVPVTVKTMDGNTFDIMVDPTDKLSTIKKQMQEGSGLPPHNQRVFMQETELDDDNKTAKAHGIKSGTVLDLEPRMFTVNVKMPDGSKTQIDLAPSDKDEHVKDKIAAKTGMAVPRQVVKFNGKVLPGFGKTVKDMGMKEGSELDVSIFKIPITVKTHDGKTIELNVEPIDTIDKVKKMLTPETGLEPSRQVLKKGEEELTAGKKTVDECGIKKGAELYVEPVDDPIVFVDIKSETLFGVDREEVITRGILTPRDGNKLDFTEAANDGATKERLGKLMKETPHLGVAPQVVVEATEVEEYDLAEAEKVKSKWGVNLKKRQRNKKGEEFIFVDPKSGAVGELSRQKYIEMGFITPTEAPPGRAATEVREFIKESEKDTKKYDKYRDFIRVIYGIKSAK